MVDSHRRLILAHLTMGAPMAAIGSAALIGGCTAMQAVAQSEGLLDASGKVKVLQTLLFFGQGVLEVASALFPGLAELQLAVNLANSTIAAVEAAGGATAAQVASLDSAAQTINDKALPYGTGLINTSKIAAASIGGVGQ